MSIGTFTSCEALKIQNNTQRGAGIGAASDNCGILGNNLGKGGQEDGRCSLVVLLVVLPVELSVKWTKQARQIDEAIPGAEAKE
jgi:hypothetical protein